MEDEEPSQSIVPRPARAQWSSPAKAGDPGTSPPDLLDARALEPARAERVERVGAGAVDTRHVLLHLVADPGLQIGEIAIADREARQELRIELRRLVRVDRNHLVLLIGEAAPHQAPV